MLLLLFHCHYSMYEGIKEMQCFDDDDDDDDDDINPIQTGGGGFGGPTKL